MLDVTTSYSLDEDIVIEATMLRFEHLCPACGYQVAIPFYDGGYQPLTTLAWPCCAAEAQAMERLPLDFVCCVECGHVFNAAFDYAKVPYSDKPNLMFNHGELWQQHLRHVQEHILKRLPPNPTVVEIGCGDGHFLRALSAAVPGGHYIGFDPHGAAGQGAGAIDLRRTLFEPMRHLEPCQPDMIISRHVMEHLINPLGFLQELAFAASSAERRVTLFIEVPCIDRVFATGRTSDFFYEHNSHFTTSSFTRMLMRCADGVELVERGYDDEVIYGFAHLGALPERAAFARQAVAFSTYTRHKKAICAKALAQLYASGRSVAIWGGTGKAAAFIHYFGLDADRFPLVIDSDPDKAGTFVPGTGQEIRFRDYLLTHPAQVILIATQWRARDIVLEIKRHGLRYEQLLLEHNGHLVDYLTGTHPY